MSGRDMSRVLVSLKDVATGKMFQREVGTTSEFNMRGDSFKKQALEEWTRERGNAQHNATLSVDGWQYLTEAQWGVFYEVYAGEAPKSAGVHIWSPEAHGGLGLRAAAEWQAHHGGHIFASDSMPGFAAWFSANSYTPSAVLKHPVLRGHSGVINPLDLRERIAALEVVGHGHTCDVIKVRDDSDNCREYYRDVATDVLYARQREGRGAYVWYSVTQEGEPLAPIRDVGFNILVEEDGDVVRPTI